MRRSVSIRRSLLVNLIAVIVLLGAGILTVTVVVARGAVRTLSEELITQSIQQTEERLWRFFGPVEAGMLLARDWGAQCMLDLDDPDQLNALLMPLMRQYRQISATLIADGQGREHMLLRDGDTWISRRVRFDGSGTSALFSEWTDSSTQPETSSREIDYDPRDRPWFRTAVMLARRAGVVAEPRLLVDWTDPYTFFTTGEAGITASTAFKPPGDELDHVIAFDVRLNDITDFTRGLRPSPNGFAFIMTYSGQVIGLPNDERYDDPVVRKAAMLTQAAELEVAAVRDGTAAYFDQPVEHRAAFPFRSGRRAWWAGAQPFELGPGRLLIIAIGVPESDLLGNLAQMRLGVIGITLAVLLAAIWRAVRLADGYSRPVEALVRQSERMSRGDLEQGEPVQSTVREIRSLAEAHEHMRLGLRTLMKLERDIQLARQIQEATFPDRLPRLGGFVG